VTDVHDVGVNAVKEFGEALVDAGVAVASPGHAGR
jgi:hypothetical protein